MHHKSLTVPVILCILLFHSHLLEVDQVHTGINLLQEFVELGSPVSWVSYKVRIFQNMSDHQSMQLTINLWVSIMMHQPISYSLKNQNHGKILQSQLTIVMQDDPLVNQCDLKRAAVKNQLRMITGEQKANMLISTYLFYPISVYM